MVMVMVVVTTAVKVTAGINGGGDTTMAATLTAMVVMFAGFLGVANLIEVRKAIHQIEYGLHCMCNCLD